MVISAHVFKIVFRCIRAAERTDFMNWCFSSGLWYEWLCLTYSCMMLWPVGMSPCACCKGERHQYREWDSGILPYSGYSSSNGEWKLLEQNFTDIITSNFSIWHTSYCTSSEALRKRMPTTTGYAIAAICDLVSFTDVCPLTTPRNIMPLHTINSTNLLLQMIAMPRCLHICSSQSSKTNHQSSLLPRYSTMETLAFMYLHDAWCPAIVSAP